MAANQNVLRQPLRARYVALAAVEDRLHQRIAARHHVADPEGVGVSRDLGELRRIRSPARRHFCAKCGSALWVADPRWPEWVYPFASAIDTPLPKPADQVELMLKYAAPWAEIPSGPRHQHFAEYPEDSIIDWHKQRDLVVE